MKGDAAVKMSLVSDSVLGLRSSASLADDAVDGFGRLGTDTQPAISLFEVDGPVFTFLHRIVGTELLDVAAITALAAINSHDLVIRTILRSSAVET